MKIITKKKMREKLKEIRRITMSFEPLKYYAQTCSLGLYAEIKKVILKK